MTTAPVTRLQANAASAVPLHAQSAPSETFGEWALRLFNNRDAVAVSTDDTSMTVAVRPAV